MIIGASISFSWQELWFLRPQFLWVFIPVGLTAIMLLFSYRRKEQWKKSFSKQLLPFLTIPGTRGQFRWPKILLLVLLSLMVLALSGPTWEEHEHSGDRADAALVVVLDLSRSMLAEDIQPNRIERAKLKILDLFKAQPNIRTALVAYAGTAHTVVPFTRDYRTISFQMQALRPEIMPLQGTNLTEALNLADSLLISVKAPGSIFFVTDQVKQLDIERIKMSSRDAMVEMMVLGTPGGAPIPSGNSTHKDRSGNTVIAGFDPAILNELGQSENVNIVTVTLDDTDVKILAASIRKNLSYIADPDQAETDWKDAGYWLLLPILLISLFWFRRGWMVHWCWLIIFLSSCSREGDIRLADLFLTRDQQGQRLYEKDETETAAERFESGEWKGYTYVEMGHLEEAAIAYSQEANATGFYNLGVVYARMGDAEAARQAFNAALELDPELEQAMRNLEAVETAIDSVNSAKGKTGAQDPDEKNDPQEFQEYSESPDEKEQAQQSDETYKGKGDVQESVTREIDETAIDFFEQGESPPKLDQAETRQTLLRQVEEDPSIFLRRKFAHQYRNRTKKAEPLEEDW